MVKNGNVAERGGVKTKAIVVAYDTKDYPLLLVWQR